MKYCEKCGGCTPSHIRTCVHCRARLTAQQCVVTVLCGVGYLILLAM